MSKRTLLIDDCRSFDVSVIARNYFEGIQQLKKNDPWDILYLDHDLGGIHNSSFSINLNREMTGYDILCWLERHQEYLPKSITLVTDNPAGRKRMQLVINKLYSKSQGE